MLYLYTSSQLRYVVIPLIQMTQTKDLLFFTVLGFVGDGGWQWHLWEVNSVMKAGISPTSFTVRFAFWSLLDVSGLGSTCEENEVSFVGFRFTSLLERESKIVWTVAQISHHHGLDLFCCLHKEISSHHNISYCNNHSIDNNNAKW